MKKTLIALMALAGAAFGADYTTETAWTLNFGKEYTNGYSLTGTMNTQGTFWDVSGNTVEGGVTTASNHRVHMAGGVYGSWNEDFQITLSVTLGETISASNGWPVFAQISGNGTALRYGPYTNAGNYVSLDGDLTKGSTDTTFSVTGGGTYTITLTKIGTSVSLAVDGKEVSTGTLADSVSGNITDIALGGDTGSNYRINETVHSISYSNVTLTPVTPETPAVPEPTTATLSLLALAGLAARRRRK